MILVKYRIRRAICWWYGCDISEVNGDHGCNRCGRNVNMYWEPYRERSLDLGEESAKLPQQIALAQPLSTLTISGDAGGKSAFGEYSGIGIQWKCKECGKYSNHIRNGVGICCSPELQENRRILIQAEKHKRDLIWALQTRALTDEEMGEVARYDYQLLVLEMVPYYEEDLRKRFSNLLLAQFRIRAVEKQVAHDAEGTV